MQTTDTQPLDQVTSVKIALVVPGNNPRKFFDPKGMEDLKASIVAQGIIQPLLVRPLDGGNYQIVAGERRWRAAKEVYGEDGLVPVFIRTMTDLEAHAASANENIIRDNMSPAEEAEVAARILGLNHGNYDETAKQLGWSRQTLEKRLALMNCSENVRNALSERKILIGHAELFATATREKQDEVLAKLLALETLPTVAEFKANLQSKSLLLEQAIFDKSDCTNCKHNSSYQGMLFAEAISEGYCTNSACFEAKTEAELDKRAEVLKDEFPTVKIIKNSGEKFTVIRIVAEGATGVGEEQAKACRGCSNFGAAVSNLPGSVGKVYKDQCFDPICNQTKVAERIKSEKAAAQTQVANANTANATATEQSGEVSQSQAKPKVEKTAPSVVDSTRVKEYRVKQWRGMLRKAMFVDTAKNNVALIALGICNLAQHIDASKLTTAFNKVTNSAVEPHDQNRLSIVLGVLSQSQQDVMDKLQWSLAASIEDKVDEKNLRTLLKFLDVKIQDYWVFNKEYLELLTKSEIETVLDEIGFKAHFGAEFSKIISGKKDEIISAVLSAEGFDFAGKVPKIMQYDDEVSA